MLKGLSKLLLLLLLLLWNAFQKNVSKVASKSQNITENFWNREISSHYSKDKFKVYLPETEKAETEIVLVRNTPALDLSQQCLQTTEGAYNVLHLSRLSASTLNNRRYTIQN